LDSSEWHDGAVQRVAPFGAIVDVTLEDGTRGTGLVHISQIKDEFINDIHDEVEVGQAVQVRVMSVDLARNKMSLSMKEEGGPQRRAPVDVTPFANLASDQWFTGKVVSFASFGAFVTVAAPGSDAEIIALVPRGHIREHLVDDPADELEIGQEVQVRVLRIDYDLSRVTLSMVEPPPEPADVSPFEGIDPDQWLTGKVTRLAEFGAFVTVTTPDGGAEALGLVHITNMKDGFVARVSDEVEVGQEVQVRIFDVDVEGRRMRLSMIDENADDGDEEEE